MADDDAAKAEAVKNQGNDFFKEGKWKLALEKYNAAIDLNPEVPTYYCNRAFCHIKMESYGCAIEDAGVALELDKQCAKAYYRRGASFMALAKYKKALADYKSLRQLKPNDKDVVEKFKACEKEVKREAFEKAIHSDEPDQESIADQIETGLETMNVEDSYDGPRPAWPLTHEAVVEIALALKEQKKLHRKYALQVLVAVKKILLELPSLVDVPVPETSHINVCGDTHGQFYDLRNIFEINGYPSEDNPYLFNGDFVDRGSFSIEVVLTLFAFKLALPNHFHLSRGNHETINMNKMYGFEGEAKHKYNGQMADFFTEVYNWLPLCHVIHNKVFVVHGGLFSRDGVTLDEIKQVDRNMQPPEHGLMTEMLWSDPQPQMGRSPSKRGTGTQFGPDVTEDFLKTNGLELLIRSHEVKENGYEVMHDGKCITIFSAPNYCDQIGNKGAFITLKEDCKPEFTMFDAVPHPAIKPMAYAAGYGSMFGF